MRPSGAPRSVAVWLLVALVPLMLGPAPAHAAVVGEIDRHANAALTLLYQSTPAAVRLAPQAKAILVFPSIVKAGFIVGAQYGNGALRKGGKTVEYYNMTTGSSGLQAGMQSFSYAMFFMTDSAVATRATAGRSGWDRASSS